MDLYTYFPHFFDQFRYNSSSSSSSFCWVSVANASNVLQPYWLIVLSLDVPALTTCLLLWGPSGQRWIRLWTLFSNVPTFATSRLQEILAAKGGAKWARNGRWILPENARIPRNIQGSFTCRKSMTWDRRLYFPSEGRLAEDFFTLKNPTASVGFEPTNLGTKGQHATSRPPKPLTNPLLFPSCDSHIVEVKRRITWNYTQAVKSARVYFMVHSDTCFWRNGNGNTGVRNVHFLLIHL